MAIFDEIPGKAASAVTAAMTDKGAVIQERMLNLVNGDDGQMLRRNVSKTPDTGSL